MRSESPETWAEKESQTEEKEITQDLIVGGGVGRKGWVLKPKLKPRLLSPHSVLYHCVVQTSLVK